MRRLVVFLSVAILLFACVSALTYGDEIKSTITDFQLFAVLDDTGTLTIYPETPFVLTLSSPALGVLIAKIKLPPTTIENFHICPVFPVYKPSIWPWVGGVAIGAVVGIGISAIIVLVTH